MGLALNEVDREARAIEFYDVLSTFDFMSSTPTLFNAGTHRSQLSSCYLTTVPDDLDGIYEAIKENALLSKFAGGLGNDWTNVRALGSHIKGTNGKSQGVVPFLKVVNDTAVAVNQGGKRKGAVCAYLETWHLDIEEFLELRKNTGDDRRRTHDMNTANWIPDLFMKRVVEGGDWTLFSPSDVPDLHDIWGRAFEEALSALRGQDRPRRAARSSSAFRPCSCGARCCRCCSRRAIRGSRSRTRATSARRSSTSASCTARTSARKSRSTPARPKSPCATSGSVNLLAHMHEIDGRWQLDQAKLKRTITTAMRMLDNVIDINYYAVAKARNSNLKHRPVGLGIMGFQDCLHAMRVPYASAAALQFADTSMEAVCYHAYYASTELAEERGRYASYKGSLWDRGLLPQDTLQLLRDERGGYVDIDESSIARLDRAARAHRRARHAQLELRGDRADGDDLEHHRRRRVDRARVPEHLREVEPVRRVHRRQRAARPGPEAARAVGRRDGRRTSSTSTARSRRSIAFRPNCGSSMRRRSKSSRRGSSRPARGARSGSTRRRASTSTWRAHRARSSTTRTSSRGCAA